ISDQKRPKEDQRRLFECGGGGNRAVSLRETVQCFFAALQNNVAVHPLGRLACAARGGDSSPGQYYDRGARRRGRASLRWRIKQEFLYLRRNCSRQDDRRLLA